MSKILTNHDEIRQWIEDRNGVPAIVETTHEGQNKGIIRILFPETSQRNKGLAVIEWDEFFAIFDSSNVALLCSDKTKTGELSRFFKFIKRSN